MDMMTATEIQEQKGLGWGGDEDMEWLETGEEREERTIIDLLEKEETVLEDGEWQNEDETLNLLPANTEAHGADCRLKGSSSKQNKRACKEGQWIRTSKGRGRDSFKWVATESVFDKKATKILQRFWLHSTLAAKAEAHGWKDMESMEGGALETVSDLVLASTKSGTDPTKVRITKVGTEEIFLNHLSTLQRGCWIHSNLVNAWSALIAKDSGHVCYGSGILPSHLVWILDSSFYDHLAGVERNSNGTVTKIAGLDLAKGKRLLRKQNVSNVSRVLIPINLNNEHWITACLNKERRTISICDSLGGTHPVVSLNLTAWFKAAFGEDGLVNTEYVPITKQVDADCGIASM
eukprot:3938195-Rhodomonas_salina.2